MSDIVKSMRSLLVQGVKAVNHAANNIANSTRFRIDELNLINRRKEVFSTLGDCVCNLRAQGVELPEELAALMEEIEGIDKQLEEMRRAQAEAAAKAKAEAEAAKKAAKEAKETEEEAAEEAEETAEEAEEAAEEVAEEPAEEVQE